MTVEVQTPDAVPRRRSSILRPAAALPLAIAGLALAACGGPPAELPDGVRPVRVVEAVHSVDGEVREFSGVLRATTRSRLSFRVPGKVIERPVEVGTALRRGDLLARLDPTDFRLRVTRAEASLERAAATAREARADYERVRALFAGDHVPRGELDRALATLERTRGAEAEAEAALELARRELGFTRLVAPAGGVVVDLPVEAGENVQGGQGVAIFEPTDGPLEVAFSVPEGRIGGVAPGMGVAVRVPSVGPEPRRGEVVEVGAASAARGSGFPVVARLADADDVLRSGMAAEVTLTLGPSGAESRGGRVLVAPEAVAADPRGRYVFVVEPGDGGEERTVRRIGVDVGELFPGGLEILAGLDGGETLVAAGVTFLDDGQTVRLLRGDPLAELPSAAPAATAASTGSAGSPGPGSEVLTPVAEEGR